jgi:hypothetical protein
MTNTLMGTSPFFFFYLRKGDRIKEIDNQTKNGQIEEEIEILLAERKLLLLQS